MTKILVVGDFQGKFSNTLYNSIKKENPDLIVSVGDHAGIEDWQPWLKDSFKRSKKGEEWLSPVEFFGEKGFKKLVKKDDEAAKIVFKKLNSFNKPVILIMGNGDDEWYKYPFVKKSMAPAKKWKINFIKKLKNIKNINYGKTKINGFNFIGFGGYMDVMANHENKPSTRENIFRKKQAIKRLKESSKNFKKRLAHFKADKIFVLHYPPKGVFDKILDKNNPYYGRKTGIDFFAKEIKNKKPLFVLCGHMHEYQGMKMLYGIPVINPGDAEKDKYAIIELDNNEIKKAKFVK